MTDVADWFAEQDKAKAARAAVPLALDARNPDEVAKQADIAKQLSIPPIVVGSDPAAFKARADQLAIVEALKSSPKTTEWLSNRDNGGVAKDDVANLTWFEKGWKDFADMGAILDPAVNAPVRGVRSGVANLQGSSAIGDAALAGDIGLTKEQMIAKYTAGLEKDPVRYSMAMETAIIRFDALEGMTAADKQRVMQDSATRFSAARDALAKAQAIPRSEAAQGFMDGAWNSQAPGDGALQGQLANPPDNTFMGAVRAIAADPTGALAFFAETAAESLPMMVPALLATAATRSPVVGAGVMGVTSGAMESSSEAMAFLTESGVQLNTPEDVMALMANQPLLAEARRRGLLKGVIVGAFDTLSGGVAGKALAKSPVGDAILQSIAQAALGAGGEAASQMAVDGNINWRDVITEGLAEFVTAPAEMMSMGRNWLNKKAAEAAASGGTAAKLDALDKQAEASKLKARSPEAFQSALDTIMDGDTLYVPADELQTLFQAKDAGFDPAEWGIEPATFAEQIAAGGKVAVPASVYAAKISGTPDADWFRQNSTTNPDEMSVAEVERFNNDVRDIVEAQLREADQARMADLESRASDVQVQDQVYTNLREAGQTKDVATANAAVLTAAIRTLASRTGQDALDMLRRFNLAVRGPETEPMRRRGNMDIALNTLRAGKTPKPTGANLTEFVRAAGGMQDVGGDLAAMELPKGVVSETRDEVAARASQPSMLGMPSVGKGKGIDDMARAAAEAGYFPGLDVEADLTEVLKDALRAEMAGQATYVPGQGGDAALLELADELSRRGIDLATATNDEVVAALSEAQAGEYNQDGTLRTDTEAFKAWFSDSVVVNEDGSPKVVYHGTQANFEAFDRDFLQSAFGNFEDSAIGFMFTDNPKAAGLFARGPFPKRGVAGQIMPVYLSVKNPLVVDFSDDMSIKIDGKPKYNTVSFFEKLREPLGLPDLYHRDAGAGVQVAEALRAKGYDGIHVTNSSVGRSTPAVERDAGGPAGTWDVFIALEPTQIKSVNNRGTWDATDPRILFQPAYHGTPHKFDKFSLDHIGSGEGAQAFGYGLYFAGKRSVAKYYREKLSANVPYETVSGPMSHPDFLGLMRGAMEGVGDIHPQHVGQIMRMIEESLDEVKSIAKVRKTFVAPRGFQAHWEAALDAVADVKVAKKKGRLFTVDVPDDADLLVWDRPLSEQPEGVLEKIKPLLARQTTPEQDAADLALLAELGVEVGPATGVDPQLEMTGEQFYEMLADRMGATSWEIGANASQRRATAGSAHARVSEALRAAGIPGHRYLDGGSRSAGDGSYNYVIYDAEAVKVLEYEQQNRASIKFPLNGVESGTSVIRLFESADLSSFSHEVGHYLLEVFNVLASEPDAAADVVADMAAIREYLGMQPGAKPTVEQHETWARTWEAYLMEGKAPTLGLMDAFARFKSWLVRIYQTAKGLNVKITPEIRDVMDRILATESEITAARAEQSMKPLFTDEVAAGMTPDAFRTYQRMARRATEQAEADLLAKTMAAVRRKTEAWWRAEYKSVMGEVTKTVNSQRPYRLTEMLANQRWLSDTPKDVPDIQLDRKELVDTFGAGVLAELSREKLGGKRAIYGGTASLMEVSELFGFASPQEMVTVLQNSGKRLDAIRAETDRIMRERYGDPLTDGSIETEALEAIHSEQQAMTVASEVRHLAGRSGLPTRNLTAQVFRQRARLMLGRMTVAEAAKPDTFLAAGRQAARRAEDAFAKVVKGKDSEASLIAATRHKEQQLLNHYLYLESRDLAKEVASGRERMQAYGKASVRAKLAGGYIEQIDTLLDQYDFRKRSKGQIARAESLTAFVDRMTLEGRAGELAIDQRVIDRAKAVHYSRLSVDELRGLFDTIANIDHLGRFKQKLLDAAEQRDLDEVVDGILGQFAANVPPNPPSRTPDAGERAAKTGRDLLNSILNADTLLREIDGRKDMGPTWMALKSKIDQGMFRLTERRIAMGNKFDEIYSVYSVSEKADMAQKRANKALGIPMAKWDLIALALNVGNQDNYERLINPKSPGHFDAAGIEAALMELDVRDWGVVQNTWDYINSFWPEIAAKEKRQTGVAPIKVEAKLMVNAPSGVTGGYYPIKYDARLSGLAEDFNQKQLAEELMGGAFGKAQTRNGHTKARAATSGQPVSLDLAVGHSHVEQVIYDLEIGEAVASSWKVLHDNRVRAAFTNAGKQSDFSALEVWQQDVASGDRAAAGGLQSIMRALRSGFTFSRLALNLSTALIQPSGLVQSAVVIGKADVAKGTIAYMRNPARWVREVTQVSYMMRQRKMTFERDVNNAIGDLALSHDGTSWVSKSANWVSPVLGKSISAGSIRWEQFQRNILMPLSFWMMQTVQFYAVDMPTWVSAYQKELAASGNEAKARTYADMITKRAQGSGLMSDRGALERGTLNRNSRQQEFPKLLTALGSYMFAKGNVAYERVQGTNFKNPAQVMSLAVDIGLLFTLEAALYAAVKGGLPGEDDDEPEDWAWWLAKQTMFSAMSTLPLFREASGAMQGFGAGGVMGSSIEVLSRPFIQAGQGELDKSAVKAGLDAAGVLLRLPSSQAKMVIDGIYEADMSVKAEPDYKTMLLGGGGKGRTLADVLFGD